MRTVALVLALLAVTLPARAATPVVGFTDTAVLGGLTGPTAIAFLPGGDLLVTQRDGALIRFDGTTTTTLATIPNCHTHAEQGLLGIAVDPGFASTGYVYLYRTAPAPSCAYASGRFNEVVRVTVSGGTAGSLTVLLTGIRTDGGAHNGGGLRIGPDGKLYVSTGDAFIGDNQGGCPGSSTNPFAQDLGALEGKVLRLELDGTVPTDNPFVGQPGVREEIFAYGFRNPFRIGFDPVTGALWAGDVGDFTIEELDIVTAGGNYGWPRCEGTLPVGCQQSGDIDPVFQYWHTNACPDTGDLPALGASVTGGSFAPSTFGCRGGHYFFADFMRGTIYDATLNLGRNDIVGIPSEFVTDTGQPVDLVFGPDGALYYAAFGGNEIRRVAPNGAQPLSGSKLALKGRPGYPEKSGMSMAAKDAALAAPAICDIPTVVGATLRVASASFDDTYTMPAPNWTEVRPGYFKYKNKVVSQPPITNGYLRVGRALKINARGMMGHTLLTDPNPVDVVLTMGGTRYCTRFGGVTKFKPGGYAAKGAPAPAACPP
jgi:glucose/arabinose dehydrogenase